MKKIKWNKKYNVDHENGDFKIFISEHTNNLIYGSVLYYESSGRWSDGEDVSVKFDLETFRGHDENRVYEACVNWIEQNLGGNYDINLVNQN